MPPPIPIFWKKVDENQVSYFIWPNLFSDSQLHKTGYTQYSNRGVPLGRGRTFDLDFEASMTLCIMWPYRRPYCHLFYNYIVERLAREPAW